MAAPGWYDDPQAAGGKRWWDGHSGRITSRRRRTGGPRRAVSAGADRARRDRALSGVLLIVGSIGTWVSVQTTGPFHLAASRGGLDRDGAITLAFAILCLILIGVWAARLGPPLARIAVAAVAAFLGLLGVIIAIADIADVQSNGTAIVESSAGWGLWLCLVASVALLV
jgi:hypothetical protein